MKAYGGGEIPDLMNVISQLHAPAVLTLWKETGYRFNPRKIRTFAIEKNPFVMH
jgi:hypothetical protein